MLEPISTMSAHLRYGARDSLIDALINLGVARGVPIAVWPPRRLPPGLFISPVRNGWISVWTPLGNLREWLPQLTASLECPGLLLEVVEGEFWITELFHDEHFLGRLELPTEAIKYDDLWARTVDSLETEGVEDPTSDEGLFGQRMDEIAASADYLQDVRELEEARPGPEVLQPFLPAHSNLQLAWDLLTEVDQPVEDEEEREPAEIEEYLERFASYLGIRDASWDPSADAEALAEGEYEGEEEGLPERWEEFILLPVPQLRVL